MSKTNITLLVIVATLICASYASAQSIPQYPQRITVYQYQPVMTYQPIELQLQRVALVPPLPRRWVLGQRLGVALNNSVYRRRWAFGQPAYVYPQYGPVPTQ